MRRNAFLITVLVIAIIATFCGVALAELHLMWTQSYQQTNLYKGDIVRSIAVDQNDNIIIAGQTTNNSDNVDVLTVKYDSDGQQQWAYIYDSPDSNIDVGYQVALSSSGDIYVVGMQESNTSEDGLVLKLSDSGTYEWASTYDGTDGLDDFYYLIRIDGSGNIICGGYHERLLYGQNALLSIYDSNGNKLEGIAINGTDNGDDFATDIAVDSTGTIYMSGSFTNSGSDFDIGIVKILPDGTQDWMETFSGAGNSPDFGGSLALDNSGNVFAAGTIYNSAGNWDPGLMVVDTQGTSTSVFNYDGADNYNERLPNVGSNFSPYITSGHKNMKMGSSGNLFMIAMDNGSKNGHDIVLLKISPAGNLIWRQDFDGSASYNDECWDFVLDSQENIYIAGGVYTSLSTKEAAIIQYDTNGNFIDAQYYSGSSNTTAQAFSIALDSNENPIIAGTKHENVTSYDAFVAKYCAGCFIDDACYPDGAVNPSNSDEICDVSQTQTAWSDNSGDDDDDDTSDDDDDDDDDTADDDDDDTVDDDDDKSDEASAKSDDDDDGGCCG